MKKGLFLTLDAFVAVGVIVIGAMIVLSFTPYKQSSRQSEQFANDVLTIFNQNVSEFSLNFTQELLQNGSIRNDKNTLLEQIGEFYFVNTTKSLQNMYGMLNVTVATVPIEFGILIQIENLTAFERDTPLRESTLVVSSKSNILGVYNSTDLWGPYIIEVRVWQ